jgi:hypothetical protein
MTPDIRFYLRMIRTTDAATEAINVGTANLRKKPVAPSTIVWEEELTVFNGLGNTAWSLKQNLLAHQYPIICNKLKALTAQSELVIRGHGAVQNNTCCGVNPVSLALFLIEAGLKESCRINITGCSLGRNSQVALATIPGEDNAAVVGSGSFAAKFQHALWEFGRLTPAVHARTTNLKVTEAGPKTTLRFDSADPNGIYVNKQAHGKIVFRIDHGGAQQMVWAY